MLPFSNHQFLFALLSIIYSTAGFWISYGRYLLHIVLPSSAPMPELSPGLQVPCCAQDSVLCLLPISIFSVLLVYLDFFPFWFPCSEQELQLYSEMLCIYSIAEILFMILQRWPRNGLGSAAAWLVWRASICFYLAYTSPARTCSVWQNTAMWLRVIKSIKALTSCNLIFHFVHIHKCLIELKLNTKKFERPNLYILFSLYRSDVISQRNYKTPLLRKCSTDLFKLCCHILEVLVTSIPSI